MSDNPSPGAIALLTRLSRVAYRSTTPELLGMRIKPYALLCYLRDRGKVPQQALGETMHIDANNLVLLLNELEAAGFVARRRDPDDRRRHIVEMTPAGLRAVERAEDRMETIEEQVLGTLTPEERDDLRRLLDKALQGAPDPVAA